MRLRILVRSVIFVAAAILPIVPKPRRLAGITRLLSTTMGRFTFLLKSCLCPAS